MGTNFSVMSEVAERVELCLFDEAGNEQRIDLPERTGSCWHGYVPEAEPALRYGYRVHGPWDPARGQRCNPGKLLLDPYARAIDGGFEWGPPLYPYTLGDPDGPPNLEDSAPLAGKSVIVSTTFDWAEDPPRARRGTRRSSTSCTSRGSRCGTPTCPRSCAAATRGWRIPRRSTTCTGSASRRWS
jgi:glycogen operon protein